jgi:hypothetical protein
VFELPKHAGLLRQPGEVKLVVRGHAVSRTAKDSDPGERLTGQNFQKSDSSITWHDTLRQKE